jgi:hypothetical protein
MKNGPLFAGSLGERVPPEKISPEDGDLGRIKDSACYIIRKEATSF